MDIEKLSDHCIEELTEWSAELIKSLNSGDSYLAEEIAEIEERYQTDELIGQGSTKRVFNAYDCVTGREVAYARLKDDAKQLDIEAFLHEARMTADLQHPNIMPVYDIGLESDGMPYFTMKKVTQDNLRSLLQKENLELETLLRIFLKICAALEYTHSLGIVHLDLKPENICVSRFDEVIVCDWGLAREVDAPDDGKKQTQLGYNMTLRGQMRGTPGYMAPEQVRGARQRKDTFTDIYSLGVILYEILYRKMPVKGNSLEEILHNTRIGAVNSNQNLWPGLQAVCRKAMALKPQDRYTCVRELAAEVKAYLNGFPPKAEQASRLKRALLFYRRSRSIINMALLFLAVISTLITISFTSLRTKEEKAQTALQNLAAEKNERIRLSRESFPQLFKTCHQAYLNGDFEQTRYYLNILMEIEPNNSELLSLTGKVAFFEGRKEIALQYLKKVRSPLEEYLLLYLKDQAKGRRALEFATEVARTEENYLVFKFLAHTANKQQFLRIIPTASHYSRYSTESLADFALTIKDDWKRQKILETILEAMRRNPQDIKRRYSAEKAYHASKRWPDLQKEFQLFIPENLALGRPAFSNAFEERSPDKAVDGNTNNDSYWAGSPTPASFILDLESITDFKKIRLFLYTDSYYGGRTYFYRILVSTDGKNYSPLIDRSRKASPSSQEAVVFDFPEVKARYIKIEMLKNSANTSAHIREIEVYK